MRAAETWWSTSTRWVGIVGVAILVATGLSGPAHAEPAPTTPSATAVPAAPAAGEAPVLLAEGVTSSRVATLQQALDSNTARDYHGTAGAGPFFTIFTPETTTALKTWQAANGYPATGTITTNSAEWNALLSQRTAPRRPSLGVTLSQGQTDPAVRTVQAALHLNVKGSQYPAFTEGVYDTYFGPLVRSALVKWQKANGLSVTGTIRIGSPEWHQLLESQITRPVSLRNPVSLKQGATHAQVKNLQTYLDRHKWKDFQPYANNVFDTFFGPATADGLKALQARLGYPADGVIEVDTMEWHHLRISGSRARAGKVGATLKSGVKSPAVRVLQQSLAQNRTKAYFALSKGYTTSFGSVTVKALKAWQKANGYPANGVIVVNSIQWGHLQAQVKPRQAKAKTATKPAAKRKAKLDSRCYTSGVVICASKKDRKVYYVNKGKIIKTLDARFGGRNYDVNGRQRIYHTVEGSYRVTAKVKNEVSYTYNRTPMPFSLYFYRGQAFHFSYGFAKEGHRGDWGSHGCINLRDRAGAEWLYKNSPVGTKVVIYK